MRPCLLLLLFAALAHGAPKVLILGDSISIGYTPHVIKLLEGEADVSRPKGNCQYTAFGLKNLDSWLGDTKWDVIHFNFGLHDLKYVDDRFPKPPRVPQRDQEIKDNPDARQLASVEDYAANLDKIVQRLKKTGARLIFCNTTPVPRGAAGRIADDSVHYNAVAAIVMEKHGVLINDLHAFASARLEKIQRPRDVHFTREGSAVLAGEVVRHIRLALAAKSK